MSDELNVWTFEGCSMPSEVRSAEYVKGYQQAIADVVEWLGVQQHGRTSDNYPGYYARQIEQRFGKDA